MNPQETRRDDRLIARLRDELGLTILLIEHDMTVVMGIWTASGCSTTAQKIAEGTPAEIQRDPRGHRGVPGASSRWRSASMALLNSKTSTRTTAISTRSRGLVAVDQGEIVS